MAIGGARFVEKSYDWKQPNRLLVVQTGESVNQAKVFRAPAVPQGLCGNLSNALKWAPPMSGWGVGPPTPLQNSYASFEEEQGHSEAEDQTRRARETERSSQRRSSTWKKVKE